MCQRGTTSLVECLTVMRHQGILHDLDHIVEVAYHLVVSRRTGPAPPENRWNTLHHNAQTRYCPASPSTTSVLCKVYTRVLAWITSEPLDLFTRGAWLIQYTNVGYVTHTHMHTHIHRQILEQLLLAVACKISKSRNEICCTDFHHVTSESLRWQHKLLFYLRLACFNSTSTL